MSRDDSRITGATSAQIADAENRCEEGGQFNAVWIRDLAEYLVPPDTRIVPVSPVRADREALVEAVQRLLNSSKAVEEGDDPTWSLVPNDALHALQVALRAAPEPERAE